MPVATALREATAAEWTTWGCGVRLVVREPADLGPARRMLTEELAAIDLACSRFRADSELARLNLGDDCALPISRLLADAMAAALHAAAVTDGDVDPTIGTAMEAVGYDRDFAVIDTASAPIRVHYRPAPGWRRIDLDPEALTVRVPPGVRLDLGATAKAFAADRAARRIGEALDGRGVLVSLGGDIAISGEAPPGGWSIRVQDVCGPVGPPPTGPTQVIAMTCGGLATSSIAARRWVRGGRVMHHLLDPRSGVPVASPWRTVTVAAATCLDANTASTASIVRGSRAVGWLARAGIAARLVDVSGSVTALAGWPDRAGALR